MDEATVLTGEAPKRTNEILAKPVLERHRGYCRVQTNNDWGWMGIGYLPPNIVFSGPEGAWWSCYQPGIWALVVRAMTRYFHGAVEIRDCREAKTAKSRQSSR
jgi:hypothetical protein